MKKSIIAVIILFAPFTSAGTAEGIINNLEVGPSHGEKVFVSIEGTVASQPACQANSTYHFAFDASEPGGKNTLSAVLAAYATKQRVKISGYAQCTRVSDVEDLRWIKFE